MDKLTAEQTAHIAARLMTKAQRAEVAAIVERLTALATVEGIHPNLGGNYSNVAGPARRAASELLGAIQRDRADRVGLNNREERIEGRVWSSYDPSEHPCPGYNEQYPHSPTCGACGRRLDEHAR
jgi:hypothetical protein